MIYCKGYSKGVLKVLEGNTMFHIAKNGDVIKTERIGD